MPLGAMLFVAEFALGAGGAVEGELGRRVKVIATEVGAPALLVRRQPGGTRRTSGSRRRSRPSRAPSLSGRVAFQRSGGRLAARPSRG